MAAKEVFSSRETPIKSENKSDLAVKRWKILSNALKRHKLDNDSAKFSTFNLIKLKKKLEEVSDEGCEWHEIYSTLFPHIILDVRFIKQKLSANDLIGFNNTGNVCVWPSEEVLAHYLLRRITLFDGKSVCELGGGMTCLAGILVSAVGNAKEVVLTDGNYLSVKNIQEIIDSNYKRFSTTRVEARVLQWDVDDHSEDLDSKFDFVICADCLFFKDGREGLAKTIIRILKPKGEAFIFAPSRSKTLQEFEFLIKKFAVTHLINDYDQEISKVHDKMRSENPETYNEDKQYPILLHIKK